MSQQYTQEPFQIAFSYFDSVANFLIIGGFLTFFFSQLEQTHHVHLSLEEKFSQGREDSAHLLDQHKLLLEQLDQEARLKSQLQLELHKAEGERRILVCSASRCQVTVVNPLTVNTSCSSAHAPALNFKHDSAISDAESENLS